MSEMSTSLRQSLIEKVVFPTLSAVLSSLVIGIVLSVLIDGKMERWKTVSTLQVNREHEARIEVYDAYGAASHELYNYYAQTGTTRNETYEAIDKFATVATSHAAFMPKELEQTYQFLDYQLIIGSLLCTKEHAGTLTAAETTRYGQTENLLYEADQVLRSYMRDWHSGRTRDADRQLHKFYAKYVEPGMSVADTYSTKIMLEEQALLDAEAAAAQPPGKDSGKL